MKVVHKLTTRPISTDSLGFPLVVNINVEPMIGLRGNHMTYFNADTNLVDAETAHTITVVPDQDAAELIEVAAHECFHMFYSIRHLITAEEETQAEVFGQLVKHIFLQVQGAAP